MNRSKTIAAVLLTVAIALIWVIGGCSGGGTGTGLQPGRGAVSGRIVDINSRQGIGEMTVAIGGQQAVSQTPGGSFTVMNISPGQHEIIVTETTLFVLPPGPPMYVTVQAGTFTNLAAPIYVIDPNYVPPSR